MNYSARQYAVALYDLTRETPGNETKKVIQSFAKLLARKGVLHLEGEIIKSFEKLAKENDGVKEVSIVAAKEETGKKLQNKFHKDTDIKTVIDPKIFGGASITIDDIRIDNSVKGRMSELEKVFKN